MATSSSVPWRQHYAPPHGCLHSWRSVLPRVLLITFLIAASTACPTRKCARLLPACLIGPRSYRPALASRGIDGCMIKRDGALPAREVSGGLPAAQVRLASAEDAFAAARKEASAAKSRRKK